MLRWMVVVAAGACLAPAVGFAGEPAPLLIVAADHVAASALPSLPNNTTLTVLIQHESESFAAVNARALKVRSATHFLFAGDRESILAAIFRERLQNQGAIAIDLRKVSQPGRLAGLPADRPDAASFANFLEPR